MSIIDKNKHFYITLPSSGCLELYPENTVTSFTTTLNNEINFDDVEYEVALVEVHVEGHVKNITRELELLTIKRYKTMTHIVGTVKLYPGNYTTTGDIVNDINKQLSDIKGLKDLKIEISNQKLKFVTNSTIYPSTFEDIQIETTHVFDKLMFTDIHELSTQYQKEYITVDEISQRCVNRLLPEIEEIFSREAFIYADICEYSNIGNNLYPLLRTINMPISPTKYFGSILFNSPHYVKLRSNRLNSIFIYIKNLKGDPWPILTGHIILKLHFKPINLY